MQTICRPAVRSSRSQLTWLLEFSVCSSTVRYDSCQLHVTWLVVCVPQPIAQPKLPPKTQHSPAQNPTCCPKCLTRHEHVAKLNILYLLLPMHLHCLHVACQPIHPPCTHQSHHDRACHHPAGEPDGMSQDRAVDNSVALHVPTLVVDSIWPHFVTQPAPQLDDDGDDDELRCRGTRQAGRACLRTLCKALRQATNHLITTVGPLALGDAMAQRHLPNGRSGNRHRCRNWVGSCHSCATWQS